MGRYIVKLPCDGKDYFLEWSSVVDAPVTQGMTWEEFQAYYKKEYGLRGMEILPKRMARVHETGTSDTICRQPPEEWIFPNKAGNNQEQLTFEEIVDLFVRNRPDP